MSPRWKAGSMDPLHSGEARRLRCQTAKQLPPTLSWGDSASSVVATSGNSPEHNNNRAFTFCHKHQGFPYHQCRKNDHREVQYLKGKLQLP